VGFFGAGVARFAGGFGGAAGFAIGAAFGGAAGFAAATVAFGAGFVGALLRATVELEALRGAAFATLRFAAAFFAVFFVAAFRATFFAATFLPAAFFATFFAAFFATFFAAGLRFAAGRFAFAAFPAVLRVVGLINRLRFVGAHARRCGLSNKARLYESQPFASIAYIRRGCAGHTRRRAHGRDFIAR